MGRVLASLGIVALLALDLALPSLPFAQRGPDTQVRTALPEVAERIGQPLPDLDLRDLSGEPLDLAELRGHPVLLTFERSVDW